MQQINKKLIFGILFICLLFSFYLYTSLKPTKEIVFGSTVALSGHLKEIGIQYTNGIKTYFSYINDQGGVQNTKIKFVVLDDKYEPTVAKKNIEQLILNQKNLFGILGTVGTPTSEEALKLALKSQIPFLMPFTGAEFLYANKFNELFTLRPSYKDEANEMVQYLLKNHISNIAVFYQNDSYGLSALNAMESAIQHTNIKIVSEGIYNRNTISIYSAFAEIQKTNPQAVIMAGAYKPTIEFIKKAMQSKFDWQFLNFSFVGLEPLSQGVIDVKNKIFITQVVPLLANESEISKEYVTLFKKYYPNEVANSVAFEGYLAAIVVVQALQNAAQLEPKSFLGALSSLNMQLFENSTINYTQNNHSGLKKVYLVDLKSSSNR